jgi:hypothetical protein
MANNFEKTLKKALNAIGVIVYNQRTIDLLKGHRDAIKKMVLDFGKAEDMNFVGMPHQANNAREYAVDAAIADIWKDTASSDWKFTPTGFGTFDNIFPESAAFLKWDKDPNHWAYVASLLEIGSANNMFRFHYQNINGDTSLGRFMVWHQSRLPALKIYQHNPSIKLRENGQIRLDGEFEGTSEAEIAPVAVHILPHEILTSAAPEGFVTAT